MEYGCMKGSIANGEQVIVGLIIASSGSRDYSLESGEGDPMHLCGVKAHSSTQSIELLARSLSKSRGWPYIK